MKMVASSINCDVDSGNRADYVFTIGCFDLLHHGHVKLFNNMRKHGRRLVIGVHDDESITLLKNRVPLNNTGTRIANVQKYADHVFVVAGTDPTLFIEAAIKARLAEGAVSMVYVRGDDMPHFPARLLVEQYMPVMLLPYTQGVSSTMIRTKLLANMCETKIPDAILVGY